MFLVSNLVYEILQLLIFVTKWASNMIPSMYVYTWALYFLPCFLSGIFANHGPAGKDKTVMYIATVCESPLLP